jgi:Arc/MetJ family transcription regulator
MPWCTVRCMKSRTLRTNIELDAELLAEATRLTGIRTKRLVVHEGLRALVDAKRRLPLGALRGKIKFAPRYDHKAMRARAR